MVECDFSHFAADDPIVHPSHVGASHLHQFFGATVVSATSTYAELLAGDTTCDQQADTAAYWTPVLIGENGEPIEPIRSVAYYRAGVGVDPTTVVAYPPGLMLVAGNAHATTEQPLALVAWSCGTGAQRSARPQECDSAVTMRMSVVFADCWNGTDLTPPVGSGKSNAVYSSEGACPESHPVPIPQLQFAVDYPAVNPKGLKFSSGGILTGHSDFWNAWDQTKLENEVEHCIQRDLVCGVFG